MLGVSLRPGRLRRWIGNACLALGAGLVAFWLWAAADGLMFRASLGRRLDALLGRGARPLVSVAHASREQAAGSGLIGRLEIPRLELSEPVIEGTSGRALRRGIGHVKSTAFPGERGNVGLAGHRDSHFARLRDVAKGDLIRLDTPDGIFAYRVTSIQIVDPGRADLLAQTGKPRLTLVTCYPFHWVGPAPQRYVVIARPATPKRSSGRA